MSVYIKTHQYSPIWHLEDKTLPGIRFRRTKCGIIQDWFACREEDKIPKHERICHRCEFILDKEKRYEQT